MYTIIFIIVFISLITPIPCTDHFNISGSSGGIFSSSSSSTQDENESSDSSPEYVDISLSNNDVLLTDVSSTTISDVPGIDKLVAL